LKGIDLVRRDSVWESFLKVNLGTKGPEKQNTRNESAATEIRVERGGEVEGKEWRGEGDGWEGMGRTEVGGGCRAGACVRLDRSRWAGFLGI
jgi:hypothetical protein